jgi:hypothetical protein
MNEIKSTVGMPWTRQGQGAEEEKLDRALVNGLMLEVILETSSMRMDPWFHRDVVKNRLKTILVSRMAGRVTLDRFHHLLHQVDHCFPLYYPLINPGSRQDLEAVATGRQQASPPPAPAHQMLREEVLTAWLETEVRKLLPQRSHRKLGLKRLVQFLQHTQGGWFRLKEFERYFGVDRKTAWEYMQKFLLVGLLRHNQGRSAAVRYAVDPRFLLVQADALLPKVREALPAPHQQLADKVVGWLVATGGEAFGEAEWHAHLHPSQCRRIIGWLQAAGLLEEAGETETDKRFRLDQRWLQE